ncbi:hypothetical protein [Parvularcula dongshanensis]|uniref:Flagellar motor protein MotA n=1 Tax=Parvularcula dongshanensis TaxID=1173995 RepID=A0A840HZB4_9PROT|nr:hypothetical protein [Parvularcula dongshanensis]MBB4657899.1 hypothetical protein [Parvularcula dongshanensis]
MSATQERAARFAGSGAALTNMAVFLGVVALIVFYLSPLSPAPNDLLVTAFMANPALNGLILVVLVLGVVYNLRQAMMVGPAVRWVAAFRASVDPSRSALPKPPPLIGAMSRMLLDADERGGRLSQASTRAILDSIGVRIDEGREFGRYAANLLVFLGLLGTFWGLLQTVNAVAEVIGSLSSQSGTGTDAVSQLIANLNAPLSGMGTAFSSSLFGLGGSLVVGFLDIQAGRAQNRFYSDLEDWLSGITDVTTATAARSGPRYAGDTADRLEAALAKLEASQDRGAAAVRQEIRQLGVLLTREPRS